jgi:PilZ domain-containing protein
MAFSLWRLFVFFGGRRACAPTVLKGYPANAGNGRAGAGEMTKYYRPINKRSGGRLRPRFARTGPVPGATFPDFAGGDETGRCRQTAGERLISLRFPADTGDQLASSGPIFMEEKRRHARTDIDEPAYVSSGGSVMSCVVRNISPDGAAIDIENPEFVPQHFRLVMAKGASVHECEIAWIQQKRIGVAFIAPPQVSSEPDGKN